MESIWLGRSALTAFSRQWDIIYMTYQRNDDTESADRPATEIEITDEMVRAGVRALACYGSDDDLETAVWSVLQAAIPLAGLGR